MLSQGTLDLQIETKTPQWERAKATYLEISKVRAMDIIICPWQGAKSVSGVGKLGRGRKGSVSVCPGRGLVVVGNCRWTSWEPGILCHCLEEHIWLFLVGLPLSRLQQQLWFWLSGLSGCCLFVFNSLEQTKYERTMKSCVVPSEPLRQTSSPLAFSPPTQFLFFEPQSISQSLKEM